MRTLILAGIILGIAAVAVASYSIKWPGFTAANERPAAAWARRFL